MTIQRYWLLDVHTRARKALPWLLLVSGLAGCVLKHDKPEVSDTMTNWLTACTKQSDCQGEASCVAGLCTLACAAADRRPCAPLSADSACRERAAVSYCDQSCRQSRDCDGLGRGYACVAGNCRAGQASAPRSSDLVLGEAMLLSELERRGSTPGVTWLEDHWSVIWTSASDDFSSPEPVTLFASDVYPSGEVERRAVPHAVSPFPVAPRMAGSRLALKASPWARSCELSVMETATLRVVSTFVFPCSGEFDAAPIPDSEDWLIAWSAPVASESELQDVLLARYRPSARELIAGPWPVVSGVPHSGLFLDVAGRDAWVAWPSAGQTWLAQVIGVAEQRPAAATTILPPLQVALHSTEDSGYALSATTTGALLLVPDGSALNAVLVAEGETSISRVAETTILDRAPGIARVDVDRYAVCYSHSLELGSSSGHSVAVAVIDTEGTLIGGPITVAAGIEEVGGCDLAWSGEELLVAWWGIDLVDQPRSANEQSTINARVVSLP